MTINFLEAVLRGQWSHIEAVIRGQFPYWCTIMRQWTPAEFICWGAMVIVSLATAQTCWRCK
jgi:hypothetical protein